MAQPVPLNPNAPEQRAVGQLIYRGGLVLRGGPVGFGGLSAIDISDDGTRLTALSDNGAWYTLQLTYGAAGAAAGDVVAARHLATARLTDQQGRPLQGKRGSDAEGLARLAGGELVVSFERDHRLLRYPPAEPPFSRPPTALVRPPGLERAPSNSGAEALTELADGRLLVIAEDLAAEDLAAEDLAAEAPAVDGSAVGKIGAAWIGDGRTWTRLGYRLTPPFKPTGAALLPDGDVVVIERSFSIFTGVMMRLVRIGAGTLIPGAPISGRELARLQPPQTVDNFEGVAARRGDNGETLLYLVSDNNFSALQRTLLMVFELRR